MDAPEEKLANGMRIQKHHDVTWIDIEHPSHEIFKQLETDYHLHPVHLRESIQKIQLTEAEHEEHYIFLLLHIPFYDTAIGKIQIYQTGIFLGKKYLITIHEGQIPVITHMFEQCLHNDDHKEQRINKSSGYLLYNIVNKLLESISALSEDTIGELDEIESLVFDNNGSDAYRIGKVRQKIVRLRRVIAPLKIVLDDLTHQINSFTGESLSKHYSNNTKTARKLLEIIDEAKDTVEIYKDADFTTSTEQTNQILAVLTLLFTFTIPITVLGTLYGMNVPLPGGITGGAWTFLGSYTTFKIAVVISFWSAIAMYLYFRQKKWF